MPTKVALLPETGCRRLHVPLLADPPQGNQPQFCFLRLLVIFFHDMSLLSEK